MTELKNIRQKFLREREAIFEDKALLKDTYHFCVDYSLLVEEFIRKVVSTKTFNGAIASVGSFSRRELSPYSDIDIMFIFPKIEGNEETINKIVTLLWDSGIEVAHTVREFDDVEKFLEDDLHTFTQFFETRFIYGDEKIYKKWNSNLFKVLDQENKEKLLNKFFDDIELRYKRYGGSAKVLEPNVKFTAGGLRDLQVVEWIYSLKNNLILTDQNEITQTESFLKLLKKNHSVNPRAVVRLLDSYRFILMTRNYLHLISNRKNDRLEFQSQEKIAKLLGYSSGEWQEFMRRYFLASNILKRWAQTMLKRFQEEISNPISDILAIKLDDDYILKGNVISITENRSLTLSEILRVFYYRGLHDARFDENLRSLIIESVQDLEESQSVEYESSVFFREILKLPKHVGKTLSVMNDFGVLGLFLPEFKELVGFFQPGVYHCYTADEHTLIALNNLEKLEGNNSRLGKLFQGIREKDFLFLAVLFHDIAKPISLSGHEIIGAEIANTVMDKLGYEQDEIALVQFLVHHHLTMEQIAFRRNLNDPIILNNFTTIFPSVRALDFLYLLTYCDLSAVSPVIWTQWKSDLLYELYRKTKVMLEDRITGEELIYADTMEAITDSQKIKDSSVRDHIEAINDLGYLQQYTREEINSHVAEIESGSLISVFFKEEGGFTNVTVICRDFYSLLSRLCGALAINDCNIHDAKIYTRNDGIVIDSFNVTDFRSQKEVDKSRYEKIRDNLTLAVNNELEISKEFNRIRTKWWRLENRLFKRKGKVKIEFEKHDKYTIVDVFSPDRLGLLYQITRKLNELGLSIYFAKIATKADDVVDSFYLLDRKQKKVSPNQYQLITKELTETIEEML